MIKYQISTRKANRQLICFDMSFEVKKGEELDLQLPTWRPGRYELANYAGNVLDVSAHDAQGKKLKLEKKSRHLWSFKAKEAGVCTFSYEYYANELNAGSTFLDETQLYVNPVNCMYYLLGREDEKYTLDFDIPKGYKVEGMATYSNKSMKFSNMDELFDSPFCASDSMKVHRFKDSGIEFTVAIQGNAKPDWKKIETDFRAFTKVQMKAFGSCPVSRYLYLIQAPDIKQYHGVEHQQGTVLALGPANELMHGKGYYDLLAVSSHELYHTWNVKYIRPQEMFPYDFTKENYHKVGYIIEGVTTYQGDLKMWQGKVISDAEFYKEINTHLDRHMANAGRFNLSVRDSSFDTWIDGYAKGTPGRKVSIYTEGALVAMITDLEIIKRTKGKYSLDEVMKRLYVQFAKKRVGYAEQDYLALLDEVGGKGTSAMVKKLIDSPVSYDKVLKKSLALAGLKVKEEAVSILASYFGLSSNSLAQPEVTAVHPDSQAYALGIRAGMSIMGVEGHVLSGNVEQWLSHFKGQKSVEFLVKKGDRYERINLSPSKKLLFRQHKVQHGPGKENAIHKRWRKAGS